jgi:hypothetical protein
MLREAEAGSILSKELTAVQVSIAKPIKMAVSDLIKLLNTATTQEVKHFIAVILDESKEP